jgi:hypothetical protein
MVLQGAARLPEPGFTARTQAGAPSGRGRSAGLVASAGSEVIADAVAVARVSAGWEGGAVRGALPEGCHSAVSGGCDDKGFSTAFGHCQGRIGAYLILHRSYHMLLYVNCGCWEPALLLAFWRGPVSSVR